MKIILTISLLLLIIIACNTAGKNSLLQKPGEVTPDEYVIQTDKDTLLVTKNGALLNIPKGTLQSSSGNAVTLEIKEAYSAEQMIRSGLTTQSNGELLSSGGMIYINAKGKDRVTITAPIKVALPTDNLQPGMQLYKGEKGKDGNVNWVNPDTLPANPQLQSIEAGRIFFEGNCSNCHSIGKETTGPDLAHFLKRYSGDTLFVRGFLLHIPRFYGERYDTNLYTDDIEERFSKIDPSLQRNQYIHFCMLRKRYGGAVGTQFSYPNGQVLTRIYQYIQNESDRRKLPVPPMALNDCTDSCVVYLQRIEDLKLIQESLQEKQDSLETDNGLLVKEERNDTMPGFIIPPVRGKQKFEEIVSPENYNARYYQFTIERFGWYNIDMLIKNIDGVKESELFVRLTGEYAKKVQVYLIIPSEKIYVQGGPAERNAEEFAFQYTNGKIMLPQGAKAYIMAVSESSSGVQWMLKEFTTGLKQEFSLSLQSTSKEQFNEALKNLPGTDIKITVTDSKNADTIRKYDEKIENLESEFNKAYHQLKPKGCDCDCDQMWE